LKIFYNLIFGGFNDAMFLCSSNSQKILSGDPAVTPTEPPHAHWRGRRRRSRRSRRSRRRRKQRT